MDNTVRPLNRTARPHRHPSQGGYPRGEDTRARIISTAIAVFGGSGYQRASTREIAARAGVNPPALQYYFNSKLGLYEACVDSVTLEIRKRIQPVLDLAETKISAGSLDDLVEGVCIIQDALVDSFYSVDEGPSINHLMGENDSDDERQDARNLMRDRVDLPINRVVQRLIGGIIGRPADDLETGIHAFAVFGQVMAFHLDQRRLANAIGWRNPDEAAVQLLKSILRSQSNILLRGLAAARERPEGR